jgi:hypothetical protein
MKDAPPSASVETRRQQPQQRFEDDQVIHLDHDQLVAKTSRPLPPAALGARAAAGLWALRLTAVLISLMVIYAFTEQLR